ncbi:MAG TPA: hypothetical protein VMJ10_07855 [Kofleriaceae bacterium]|nr:hypothetical protein [Kofleriaceae bacterium]
MPSQPPTTTSLIGHILAALIGAGALVAGVEAGVHDLPSVMTATLLVCGALLPVLAWMSVKGSRASWSFTIAIITVLGLITLFGAPKVRTLLDVGLPVAALIPITCIVAVTVLSTLGTSYQGDAARSTGSR